MSKQHSNKCASGTPLIICIAESIHYLVGLSDTDNNFYGFNNSSSPMVVASLVEAKQYLIAQNIFAACIEYQSAYDEMCGNPIKAYARQKIRF